MTIELINSLFNFNRLYFYNETFMSYILECQFVKDVGKSQVFLYRFTRNYKPTVTGNSL